MSLSDEIKNGLQHKYPSHNLAARFEEFLVEEEYDVDLIREDIVDEEEQNIVKHLLSVDCDIDKDELKQTLLDIVSGNNNNNSNQQNEDQDKDEKEYNAEPEQEANNAEPHNNDNSIHKSLLQTKPISCIFNYVFFVTEVMMNNIYIYI